MRAPARVRTLKIDERDVGARDDQTIFEVARENGIALPALCHMDGLSDIGACRLCLVEVKGARRLLPACTTEVEEGMEVTTTSETLSKYRRMILEFFFSERNHICAVCVANGNCELQSLAQRLGMDHVEVPYLHPKMSVDASHERFVIDHNRCILCTRCVRVCDEVEGAHTWDVMGRGIKSLVITDLNQSWGESTSCTSCGKCVHICPTGALFEKGHAMAELKQSKFLSYLNLMREGKR